MVINGHGCVFGKEEVAKLFRTPLGINQSVAFPQNGPLDLIHCHTVNSCLEVQVAHEL